MSQHQHTLNQTIHFDIEKYDFDKMFLNAANKYLNSQGLPAVAELAKLHQQISINTIDGLYAALYGHMDSEEFLNLYRSYIREVIYPLVGSKFYYQKKPGIRLHLPGTKTVQYHTDEWYGHGEDVLNFWSPLTKCYDTNSLYMTSLDDSVRVVERLENEKANMSQINDALAAICKPLSLIPGSTYCFCSKIVHGAEENKTPDTRVSLDYRVLVDGDNPGSKPLGEYYEHIDLVELSKGSEFRPDAGKYSVASYLFPKNGFSKFISQHHQRLINQNFADKHKMEIVAEETEIKTMSHHPMLLSMSQGLSTHKIDAVVLFSVLCLPEAREDREKIYSSSIESGTKLFFANEGVELSAVGSVELIENTRKERMI
jgi:sporadic carbohydrate cluster 2OG-Fe(II) oxygenase/sporadic carbohydrate cluster protein (TIGR04323 family)